MVKQISAWEQHRRDQEQRMFDREAERVQAEHERREHEASMRRRIAIQPYSAPLLEKLRDIREKLWKRFD